MLEWIARGLHKGIVTTGYPRRPEPAPDGFRGRVELLERGGASSDLEAVCPTGAIRVDAGGRVSLDRGRCILCGACVEAAPDRFRFVGDYLTATRRRNALVAG